MHWLTIGRQGAQMRLDLIVELDELLIVGEALAF